MKWPHIELTLYKTYYFADVVKDMLEHGSDAIDLEDFFGDERRFNYLSPFPRFSVTLTGTSQVLPRLCREDQNLKPLQPV